MGGGMGNGSLGGGGVMGGGGGGGGGVSEQIIQQLGLDPSNLTDQVFVANLDYNVNETKLREIFKMAGNVVECEVRLDKEGKSRGIGLVKFEHIMEAIQAISMFNGQVLFDRVMSVRMDKLAEQFGSQMPMKLPTGLKGIGMGLGSGGMPLHNINQLASSIGGGSLLGGGAGSMNALGASSMGTLGNSSMSALGGGLGGGLGAGAGGGGMSAASLNSGLATGGLSAGGLGNMGGLSSGFGSGGGVSNAMDMSGMGLAGAGGGIGLLSGGGNQDGFGGGLAGMDGAGLMGMGGIRSAGSLVGATSGSSNGAGGAPFKSRTFGGRGRSADSVSVRNLPFSYTWQNLRDAFKDCGDVRFAEIQMQDGRSSGCGVVRFHSSDGARRAVNLMNGLRIDGRAIVVQLEK